MQFELSELWAFKYLLWSIRKGSKTKWKLTSPVLVGLKGTLMIIIKLNSSQGGIVKNNLKKLYMYRVLQWLARATKVSEQRPGLLDTLAISEEFNIWQFKSELSHTEKNWLNGKKTVHHDISLEHTLYFTYKQKYFTQFRYTLNSRNKTITWGKTIVFLFQTLPRVCHFGN